jgi:hypothetical protein
MRIGKGCWWLALLLGTWGCGSSDADDESFDIGSGTLSGKIGGADFTFVAGQSSSFLSDESTLFVDLYADPITTACQNLATDKNHVIVRLPREPGDYTMSFSLNATFVIEGQETDNLLATRGRLVVEEVTDTQVRGGAHIVLDSGNEVSGKFQIAVCP